MILTFYTNFINHHQVHLADELYRLLGRNYFMVVMEPLPNAFINNGYPDYSDRPYLIKAYNNDGKSKALSLAIDADVVIIGSAPDTYIEKRLALNKLTFRYNERFFKSGYYTLLSPVTIYSLFKNHIRYRNKNLYMLCASAFTVNDTNLIFAYPDKCFKWGYFSEVNKHFCHKEYCIDGSLTLMWCSRFVSWKHPELPVKLARMLKDRGCRFRIDMYGSGEEYDNVVRLANELEVLDKVKFYGAKSNSTILEEMRCHDIFLFTSDRNEGWGVVANESLSNGCVLVASDQIGSVPYLLKDGYNGLVFKSNNIDSLFEKVIYLFDNPNQCKNMAINAFEMMRNIWSPANAAHNLLMLIDSLVHNSPLKIEEGPCSKAYPVKYCL